MVGCSFCGRVTPGTKRLWPPSRHRMRPAGKRLPRRLGLRGDPVPVRPEAVVSEPGVRRSAVIEPGQPDELAPGLVRITAANPGVMTGPGTNTYLVGTGDQMAVIDPGPDDPDHLEAVAAAGDGRIRWILVTHTHRDHWPGAAGLARRTGAARLGFASRDGFEADQVIGDGFELRVPGLALRAIHTPGHASNHLC